LLPGRTFTASDVLVIISLDGEDLFEAFAKLLIERGSIIYPRPSLVWDEIVDTLIAQTKMDTRMERYFIVGIKSLISKKDTEFSCELYSVISKMLTLDPEARLADLAIVKSLFSPPLRPDALFELSLEELEISDKSTE